MPGIFGFIHKREASPDQSRRLIEKMGQYQYHNPNYRIETCSDSWFGLGSIDIPQADFIRFRDDSQRKVVSGYTGFVYGHGTSNDDPEPNQIGRLIGYFLDNPENCPNTLNGSYNAAFVDREKRKVLIFNDRLGHHQLYYYEDDSIFLFAGEFKAFYAHDKFNPELNLECVYDHFNYTFPLGDKTFLKNVWRLRWGHRIDYDGRSVKIEPYFRFRADEDSDATIEELIEESDALYRDNLRRQSIGADNILLPLSGGLDSRMVLGHVAEGELPAAAFTHGTRDCLDAVTARKAAGAAGIEGYNLVEVDPVWVAKYAEDLIYLTGGVLPTVSVILMGVLRQYRKDPIRTAFMNGLAGRTAFAYAYFNKGDIGLELSLHEKALRMKRPLFGEILDDNYYAMFHPDIRDDIRENYLPEIEKEFSRHFAISDEFCHQRDFFMLENRYRGNFDQVDVNRFYYHDHMALEDNRTIDFYMKIPAEIKAYPTRTLLVESLKKKFRKLAEIPTQNTGLNLFETPSDLSRKIKTYQKKTRYYLERLTGGMLNFPDKTTYVHFNQWYRKYPAISELYEGILTDDTTVKRGLYHQPRVAEVIARQRSGGNAYNDLAQLLSLELINRIYIDRPDFERRAEIMRKGLS